MLMPDFFADEALTQPVRDAIRALALNGRQVLTREARDLLEGVYDLHTDGTLEKPENLPALKDPETRQIYDRLRRFLKDEVQAGLALKKQSINWSRRSPLRISTVWWRSKCWRAIS